MVLSDSLSEKQVELLMRMVIGL